MNTIPAILKSLPVGKVIVEEDVQDDSEFTNLVKQDPTAGKKTIYIYSLGHAQMLLGDDVENLIIENGNCIYKYERTPK